MLFFLMFSVQMIDDQKGAERCNAPHSLFLIILPNYGHVRKTLPCAESFGSGAGSMPVSPEGP